MTEIMRSPAHFPSRSSSITTSSNDGFHQQPFVNHEPFIINNSNSPVASYRRNRSTSTQIIQGGEVETEEEGVLAVLATVLRKSLVGCKSVGGGVVEEYKQQQQPQRKIGMEIGCPTNVRHVAHVTFDRFNGFLGLPVEFEPDVPRRPPSASTRVFGVSTESMQLSFDSRGNCVPTILLMMQRRLYSQGGLQSEGIFRINPENSQEEYVREQLNNGLIPDNIDVHCLAGLIKAWFRELPSGILDCLSPELVMQANTEEECVELVRLLPPTESALFDWAINLMADVAQLEQFNKMNARNIAMVFSPNMTQMSDPLTALMYAVQVMNFLKNLVVNTLREREDSKLDADTSLQYFEHSDEDDHHIISKRTNQKANETSEEEEEGSNSRNETLSNHIINPSSLAKAKTNDNAHGFLSSIENIIPEAKGLASGNSNSNAEISNSFVSTKSEVENGNSGTGNGSIRPRSRRTKSNQDQPSNSMSGKKESRTYAPVIVPIKETEEKRKEISIISRVNSHSERVEAWR